MQNQGIILFELGSAYDFTKSPGIKYMATDDMVLAYLQNAKERMNFAELSVDLSGILLIQYLKKSAQLVSCPALSTIPCGVSSLSTLF